MSQPGTDSLPVPRVRRSPSGPAPEGIVRPYRYDKTMGEVRVAVDVTNSLDVSLANRGQLDHDHLRHVMVEAVVDTGAVQTVIPHALVEKLGLMLSHQSMATYADGHAEIVPVTEPVMIEILGRRTYEVALVLGEEVLIGQTVLEKLDLWVDCRRQRLVPNPEHPDYPVAKIR